MARIREIAVASAKDSAVFGVGALPVAFVLLYWIHISFVDMFGFVLLVESCGLMLIGGAMDMTSTPAVRRFVSALTRGRANVSTEEGRNFAGAAVYTLTGVILFCASLAVAMFLVF